MAWIKVYANLPRHPKVHQLASIAGRSIFDVMGGLVTLWVWALEYAQDGKIEKWRTGIKSICGIDPQHLIDAGFLDESPLTIHDWNDYTGEYFRAKYKNKIRKRHRINKKQEKITPVVTPVVTPVGTTGNPSVCLNSVSILNSSLSSISIDNTDDKESNKIANKSIQTEFVEKFRKTYEQASGQPFKMDKKHFIIAANLIKSHGLEAVEQKAAILSVMCRDKTVWFTKDGWADFTIEKLSSQWNSIIPQATMTEEDKSKQRIAELFQKEHERNERVNKIVGNSRATRS